MKESFDSDTENQQALAHHFITDFDNWIRILGECPELTLYKQALREYQFALVSLLLGHYRQAFSDLRYCLELSAIGVLFSANEMELRLWLLDKRDLYWSEVLDQDKGVFSTKFSQAFFPELVDKMDTYRAICEAVYRECSEYVHGNRTAFETLPEPLAFNQALFIQWHQKARNVRLVIMFMMCLRYLKFTSAEHVKELENIIVDDLGHISEIRSLLAI